MKKQHYFLCGLIILCLIFIQSKSRKASGSSSHDIIIALAGDTMLGRLTGEQIMRSSFDYPWGDIKSLLFSYDMVFVNLETTLTKSINAVPKVFNFKADPRVVQTLQAGNIHAVSLANNHSLDFGIEGLEETLQTLDKAHIHHVGAGMNIHAAQQPVVLRRNGVTIGIIGYTDNEPDWQATLTKPGTNYLAIEPFSQNRLQPVLHTIAEIKKRVDICIISLHWGPNMRQFPSEDFVKAAHAFVDAGADIIHGHSAHIVQGIEVYRNKLILYDTGDFVDDYAVDQVLRNDLSCLFEIIIRDGRLWQLRLIPIYISDMQVNRAKDTTVDLVFDMVRYRSKPFGTQFKQIDQELILPLA